MTKYCILEGRLLEISPSNKNTSFEMWDNAHDRKKFLKFNREISRDSVGNVVQVFIGGIETNDQDKVFKVYDKKLNRTYKP